MGRPPSDLQPRFPNRVRALRLAAQLTQEQLAEKIGVTFSAIGKLERGQSRLRIDQAKTLARVFKIPEIELFLPLEPYEREALQLLRAASPQQREYMLELLRVGAKQIQAKVA